jgi:collagen type III alpha/collagen type V/XI/XXIV/XXVII alpha
MRAKCVSAPPEVDLEMFEHADKAQQEEERREKREKAEHKKVQQEKKETTEPTPSPPPSRSRSDDRLDEPALGGALGLGFLGISSGSLAAMDEGDGEKRSSGKPAAKEAEKKEAPAREAMSVAEIAKALLAELRGLEDRVEVAGDESGPMVLLKLGSALEAIRDEPFKSI